MQVQEELLKIIAWAEAEIGPRSTALRIRTEDELPEPMANSVATGTPLVSNGRLGVDLIRTPAGQGFLPHTHPGDHLLIVVGGYSTITFGGVVHGARAGTVYAVDGSVPHAVGGVSDTEILAVGSPHVAVDSPDRMALVDYAAVLAPTQRSMSCRICNVTAELPDMLHDFSCGHCPCPYDLTTGDDQLDEKLRAELDLARSEYMG